MVPSRALTGCIRAALITERRGVVEHTETLDVRRVMLTATLPLNEILIDFHDRI